MKIGIGITTRKRPDVLKASLEHFTAFATPNSKVVIVEDDPESDSTVEFLVSEFQKYNQNVEVVFRKSWYRLGISKAKNACLSVLTDCDHIFLFDDDSWPKTHEWAEKWVEINKIHKVGHSMWLTQLEYVGDPISSFNPKHIWTSPDGNSDHNMISWTNCMGLMLYFTRECLNTLGGYDQAAPNVYGFEHAQISRRANKAGFSLGHDYLSPELADKLIYSVDVSCNIRKEEPPIQLNWTSGFNSSVTAEEQAGSGKNAVLFSNTEIHIPLVDPLAPPV